MQLNTFSYQLNQGWSVPSFPQWDSPQTVVFIFGSAKYLSQPEIIADLTRHYPASLIMGCSTSGEILSNEVKDDSLTVAVAKFERTEVQLANVEVLPGSDSVSAGKELAASLDRHDLRAVLVLSDGLSVNGSKLVDGMNSVFPKSVVVTGGLAGDGVLFKQTWVLHQGKPTSHRVSALGLYGNHIHIGHGSRGGWENFGPERTVTHSEGNILYKLDNKPALGIYKEYLGDRAKGLPATALLFPLSMRDQRSDDKRLVRTILAVDEEKQSMTFAGDIKQGSLVQLMRANFDRLVEGASSAAGMTLTGMKANTKPNEPVLSIAISCVGRRLVLGERTEDELEATLEVLPKQTQQIGFYSYGEISPFVSGASCDLQNQTMTLTVFSES